MIKCKIDEYKHKIIYRLYVILKYTNHPKEKLYREQLDSYFKIINKETNLFNTKGLYKDYFKWFGIDDIFTYTENDIMENAPIMDKNKILSTMLVNYEHEDCLILIDSILRDICEVLPCGDFYNISDFLI